jgi:tetratricopeptide (TPR) repeat protein
MKRYCCLAAVCVLLLGVVLALKPQAVVLPPECPVSLTNPDGQALILEKYDLRVAVHGPLSLVEMEMTFRNPENRQMEGRFQYLLPPGATISRFAKEVNGKLMEGEVVERLRAQAIYTQILHTMRDPALLEMDQGNRFSARVFPIPANGTTRLLLAYSKLLPIENGERKLVVPMAGLPAIGDWQYRAVIEEAPGEEYSTRTFDIASGPRSNLRPMDMHYEAKNYTPKEDIVLVFKPKAEAPAVRALKAGNYQMLCYRPEIPNAAAEAARDWAFYFDTSASNADTEARRLETVEAVFVYLDRHPSDAGGRRDDELAAFAFDLGVTPLATLKRSRKDGAPAFGASHILPRLLRARHALGATNLEAALKHIGEQARAAKNPTRFVLVSDGIATMGAREHRDLVAVLGDWPAQHVLHALVIGNKQDEKTLSAIVEKTRGRVVSLPFAEKLDDNVTKAVAELREPLGMGFEFYDEGAAWIYPKTFRDVRPGGEMIVFSELKDGAQSKPGVIWRPVVGAGWIQAKSEDFKVSPTEAPAFAPLLQREACRAYLDHLDKLEQAEGNEAKRTELRKQRIEVSVKNRVLCPLTSLLVLETEDDYRRSGIERTALADIILVGKNGIELKKRGPEDVPLSAAPSKGARLDKAEKRKARMVGEAEEPPAPRGGIDGHFTPADATGQSDAPALVDRMERLDLATAGIRLMHISEEGAARMPALASRADRPATSEPLVEPPLERSARDGRERAERESRRSPDAARNLGGQAAGASIAPAKPNPPEWLGQYGAAIKEEQFNELRARVAGAPRDRTLRNAYADALKKGGQWDSLQGEAFAWLPFDPENPQVFEFLGNSATGLGDNELALRAFTSIAEVAPNRAALLARSGWLLLTAKKYEMAEQMFREALKNRQDDCNIYRGLALSLWLSGKHDAAAKVLEDALAQSFHERYGDAKRVLREELGYLLRSWQTKEPAQAEAANTRANKNSVRLDQHDALRVTLCWETDANDVDLHVVDPNGEECFYSHKNNASGLELYSDQTQGLGPEVIRCKKTLPGTYHIGVNYFSAGPMGVSRGVVIIMQPKDGVVGEPQILPFCLVPGGPDMRHLGAAKF